MPTLYVVYADGEFLPYAGWIAEAWEVIKEDRTEHADWCLSTAATADSNQNFHAPNALSVIARAPGPALLVGRLSTLSVALLEKKLKDLAISQRCEATDSTAIYQAMLDLISRHVRGEPEIPRRLAVALMLIAKLERMHYWGGNAKNFMSVHNLAKGNGLDKKYADTAHNVAEYLSSEKHAVRLMADKLGDGAPKYACNNAERVRVYDFLRNWAVDDPKIMQWFARDSLKVSTRELDSIRADYSDL